MRSVILAALILFSGASIADGQPEWSLAQIAQARASCRGPAGPTRDACVSATLQSQAEGPPLYTQRPPAFFSLPNIMTGGSAECITIPLGRGFTTSTCDSD